MIQWIKKHPLSAFFLLAISITWLAWIPQAAYSHGLFPFDSLFFYILGGIGPMLAAYIVLKIQYGKEATNKLFSPLFHWKVNFIWYLIAIFGFAFIMLAATALSGDFKDQLKNLNISSALFMTFFSYLIAAIPEEIGWRGFALPRLQSRFNSLVSTLILGLIWALWHLPILFNKNNSMSEYPIHLFFIDILAGSIIYTFLFNSTRGSVLIMTIYHTFVNTFGIIFNVGRLEQTIVIVFVAVLIIIIFGPLKLSVLKKPVVHQDTPSEMKSVVMQ